MYSAVVAKVETVLCLLLLQVTTPIQVEAVAQDRLSIFGVACIVTVRVSN